MSRPALVEEQPPRDVLLFVMAFGGALCLSLAAIPGFTVNSVLPKVVLVGIALACWSGGLAILRWGLTTAWLFPVFLAADAAVPLLTLVIDDPMATSGGLSIYVLPTVLAAVYGTRRQIAIQVATAMASAALLLWVHHIPTRGLLLQLTTSTFTSSAPPSPCCGSAAGSRTPLPRNSSRP